MHNAPPISSHRWSFAGICSLLEEIRPILHGGIHTHPYEEGIRAGSCRVPNAVCGTGTGPWSWQLESITPPCIDRHRTCWAALGLLCAYCCVTERFVCRSGDLVDLETPEDGCSADSETRAGKT